MKKAISLWAIAISSLTAWTQSGLAIQPATQFLIASGTMVSVDGLVLQPSVNFTVTAPNNLVRNTAITNPAFNASIKRAFKLSNTVNGFSGIITIYYLDAELNGIPEAVLALNVHNGASWSSFNTGVTRDATNNFVATAALSNVNLNELTLASVLAPLPLSWGPVIANRIKKAVQIKWSTYNEFSTGSFEIERSADGIQFIEAGLKTPAHNTGGDHHYEATDLQAPAAVKTFYRIKETDLDGRITYSPVVWVNAVDGNYDKEIAVYPNPASGVVNVQLASGALYIRCIQLYSACGQLLKTGKYMNSNGGTIPVNNLAPGIYWLQIELSGGHLIWHSFIKQ